MLASGAAPGPGTRIGPYEIVSPLGQGGMGQVYRATDTRLKRDVALKLLPASVSGEPDRVARLRREAELLASLNHPNIAHVYGLEETERGYAVAMELAEGPTLAERIAAGPVPLDDALAIAGQVLDALEAAHLRGIVHRDLKPANIVIALDGTVKVLDFGLAKAVEATSGVVHADIVGATVTSPALTAMGLILGTAAYMAPEQARGRPVDRRADLWAFGCVLYEMLTGARAFGGDDVTETLAAVLKSEISLAGVPATVPPRVRSVIAACLQKDARQRLASAQDARLLLDGVFDVASGASAPVPLSMARRVVPYALVALVGVAGLVAWALIPEAPPPLVGRFTIQLPEGQEFRAIGRNIIDVAPDGSALLYNSDNALRLRRFNESEPRPIPGTEAPIAGPVFSPDGQQVAFFSPADAQIKRLATAGGAPLVLVRDVANPLGIDWSESGTMLVALREGIARIPNAGGTPEIVVQRAGTERLAMPQLLPGGDAVLFTVLVGADEFAQDQSHVAVQLLRTGERRKVLDRARAARYLPTGHVVYAVENALFAAPFDLSSLRVSGASMELIDDIWWRAETNAVANWSVSRTGTLVYVPDLHVDALQPVWVARDGSIAPVENLPGAQAPRLSPDGKRLLVEIENDVWVYEIETGRRVRLTTDRSSGRPAWHPRGQQVAYTSERSGSPEAWVSNADGTGTPRQLTDLPGNVHVDSWSPNGTVLAFHHHAPGDAPTEIMTIAPGDPAAKPQPFVRGAANAEDAVFSPDGRYVAYLSAESGRRDIYVRAFPGPGPQVPVSVGGGREPVWGRTGELYYRSSNGDQMMAVKITTTPTLTVGPPVRLFQGTFYHSPPTGSPRPQYDVTPDGRRFLMLQRDRTVKPKIVVVQNWFEELRQLLPAK